MSKLTQNDLWLLEVMGTKKSTISELYRIASASNVNISKVDKSLDKLVAGGKVKFENKKYSVI